MSGADGMSRREERDWLAVRDAQVSEVGAAVAVLVSATERDWALLRYHVLVSDGGTVAEVRAALARIADAVDLALADVDVSLEVS